MLLQDFPACSVLSPKVPVVEHSSNVLKMLLKQEERRKKERLGWRKEGE